MLERPKKEMILIEYSREKIQKLPLVKLPLQRLPFTLY